YVAPAHGRGWHPPSFDPFEPIAHDGEAGGVADSGAQCPVTGAGGPGGDDGGGWWCAECPPVPGAGEGGRGGCEGVAVGGVGGHLAWVCAWRDGDGVSLDLRHCHCPAFGFSAAGTYWAGRCRYHSLRRNYSGGLCRRYSGQSAFERR